MKKRLSLLMVLMMVLSLVPMSVFAAAGSMPNGRVEANDNETVVKELTVKLTQAAYTKLKAGTARLTLNKGEFAKHAPKEYFTDYNASTGTSAAYIANGGDNNTEFAKIQRVAFNVGRESVLFGSLGQTTTPQTSLQSGLNSSGVVTPLANIALNHNYNRPAAPDQVNVELDSAFKNVAHVKFPNIEVGSKDMDIILTLYVLFDEESAGDVTLSVEEVGDSGLKVADPIKVAVIKEGKSKDLQMVVADKEKKIGKEGGTLSKVEIKEFKNSKANQVILELPDYMSWKNNMKIGATDVIGVSVDGVAIGYNTANGQVLRANTVPAAPFNINDISVVLGGSANEQLIISGPALEGRQYILVEPVVDVKKRDASLGDVTLKATSYIVSAFGADNLQAVVGGVTASKSKVESVSEVIGMIASYDVTMKAREKDKKEIPALYGGDKAKIRVKLSGVVGSFTANRDIDFTVNGAKVVPGSIKNVSNFAGNAASPKNYEVDKIGYVKNGEFTLTNSAEASTKKDLEFELEIKTDYSQNGPVVLKADARDFGVIECELAKVTPAYTVEFANVTPIKKGESKATADVIIKEAKAGMIENDEYLVLNLRDQVKAYTDFGVDYKIETTNGLKVEDQFTRDNSAKKRDLNSIALAVKTTSTKEAGTITISNLVVNISGSAVDGDKMLDTYIFTKEELGNPSKSDALDRAIDEVLNTVKKPDYSKAYVKVVKEYGSVAKTTVFKIGSKEYTENGETKTANEAPYISGKGYTMLPVRAVADSLGLTSNWNAATKTATFSSDSKVASVVIGADVMYANGNPTKLAAKAEIKNGSTFVELRSLASAFGVKLEWDAATKSVTIQG